MLVLSAFFSGSEIAFVSANKLGIEVLKNKGSKRGEILAGFYEKPRDFLGSMLVGNNITLVMLTIFMSHLLEPTFESYFGQGTLLTLLVVTLAITLLVLVFGEFIPKTIFRLFSNELLYRLAYPLRFFIWILALPTYIMTTISNFLLKKVLKAPEEDVEEVLSRIDLEEYINEKALEDEDIDKEILTNALNLGQLKVRDCLVPRNEIIHVDKSDSIDELIEVFRKEKISRVIVIDGDLEDVLGYIHHQQLLSNPSSLKDLILPINFIPEAMGAKDLMSKFTKEDNNIACVVDEFGSVSGVITLEDILEEIFGEIVDEHDQEELTEEQVSEDEFVFAGRHEISYLNEKYPQLEIREGEYQTLSGYIVMSEENIPELDDEITIGNLKFVITQMSDTRIEVVRVIRLH